METKHLFPYKWYLKDGYPAKGIEKHGKTVFGTFICWGGSTMGYKLAGYDHLGGVEIDDAMSTIYTENHNPKYLYHVDIREFNKLDSLPEELYNLDILDGSPPCSTFSMAGSREKAWGKEKHFKEGQAKQTLDDLVFVYCDTIIKLMPKVFLLENVTGIVKGNAKLYSKKIVEKMQAAGYTVQVFQLNAASMGVPQKRERVFFIGHRKEYDLPKLKMEFNETGIYFKEVENNCNEPLGKKLSDSYYVWWKDTPRGKSLSTAHPNGSFFNSCRISETETINTITATSGAKIIHHTYPNEISDDCLKMCWTYPMDYEFREIEPKYLIGMSVPPIMTAQVANQIYLQWLSKI